MASKSAMVGSFIESAPPGELNEVVNDIKTLTSDQPNLLKEQEPAFKKYNEQQFTTVKLPGSSQDILISPFNAVGNGRYFDTGSSTSFAFDHTTQKASDSQSQPLDSKHSDLVNSLNKSFSNHASEHFPSSTTGVFPFEDDSRVALVLVANKYSPNNFWTGRWRSQYTVEPSSGSVLGNIKVDVHYYEDGNVRLQTEKPVSASVSSSPSAVDIVKQIAMLEKRYQEDLNRAFVTLSEGAFKNLRRQLPVTRQKVEWEKISGYRLGQDIGGGRSR